MKGHAPISRVYEGGVCEQERDPLEEWGRIERMRRRAWLDAGVISVRPAELPPELAGQLQAWAEINYGKR